MGASLSQQGEMYGNIYDTYCRYGSNRWPFSGVLVAYVAYVNRNATVLEWNFMSFILRGGGVFVPLTLAIFKPGWLSPPWAIASIIASTSIAIISKLVLQLSINPLYLALSTSALIIFVGIMVSGKAHRARQNDLEAGKK